VIHEHGVAHDALMNVSEDTLVSWSQGPGKTEAEKADNAETAMRKAIAADSALSKLDISIFAQGSYKARTNVRQDSDVDICVRYNEAFFPDYPEGTTDKDFGNIDNSLTFDAFKAMVDKALKSYFGERSVTRGDKAFDVHANTYRIDADVIPTFEHRRYTGEKNIHGADHYLSGVAFLTDGGDKIINWPQQTYDNGVEKNNATGRHYKRIIRILKRLRNKMQEERISPAQNIGSFLIECLVWNAPLEAFTHETYTEDLRYVLAYTFNQTRNDVDCWEWGEVNELKYLFRSSQPWTRIQANSFLDAAWEFIGFE
jgi:predicted nucleotidyltransferase